MIEYVLPILFYLTIPYWNILENRITDMNFVKHVAVHVFIGVGICEFICT